MYEAVAQFMHQAEGVDGRDRPPGIALVIDLITAMLTYTLSKTSMNIRAAATIGRPWIGGCYHCRHACADIRLDMD